MKTGNNGWGRRLGYCTNIHPGESLDELHQILAQQVSRVRAIDDPGNEHWPVGLRISGAAATALESGGLELARSLGGFLKAEKMAAFTVNGFPHGAFHGTKVKSDVYRPDWTEPERGRYTRQLANAFAELLPVGGRGSLSTVPVGYRSRVSPEGRARAVGQLHRTVEFLADIERETGRRIELALEPEPDCVLSTVADFAQFFSEELLSHQSLTQLCSRTGWNRSEAVALIQRHIGLCLDACHAAVQFEAIPDIIAQLRACGARLSKLQISAALAIEAADEEALAELAAYEDEVYLHQVCVRDADGVIERFSDLGPALRRGVRHPGRESWRVHFHVPIHRAHFGQLGSTRNHLVELIAALGAMKDETIHDLEVETYTWDILPPEQRMAELADSIAAELAWARSQCEGAGLLDLPQPVRAKGPRSSRASAGGGRGGQVIS